MISTCWNLVCAATMVRTMACMWPSTAVVVSKNHLYDCGVITGGSADGDRALVHDGGGRLQEHAPLHLDHRGALGPELLHEVVGGHLGLEDVAAGEDVHGSVPVLGPGVDRKVGLGDDHHAADPERIELVEDHVHDGGLSPLGRFYQGLLHGLEVVDGVGIAIEQLEQEVTTECVQSTDPPLSDPTIYRTSPATRETRHRSTTTKFVARKKT